MLTVSYSIHLELVHRIEQMELVITQLAVKILFDDYSVLL